MTDGEARPLIRSAQRPTAAPRHRYAGTMDGFRYWQSPENGPQQAMIAKRHRCQLCNGKGHRGGLSRVDRVCERCGGTGRDL